MTSGTIRHDVAATPEWPRLGARLGAIVDYTSRLGHRYVSVEFDHPSVLDFEQIVNPGTVKWCSPAGADVWLKTSSHALTIAVRLSSLAHAGTLIFWAMLDPLRGDNSISGLIVGRPHEDAIVGKARRAGGLTPNSGMLCVIATATLSSAADRNLLSLLAKGFSEAATDDDRDAWVSWLWNEVSQGRLSSSYVKKLVAKVLGPHARQVTVSTCPGDSMDMTKLLKRVGVFERGADYVLPSGLHAAVHVNLGVACGYPAVVRQLAERVKQLLDQIDYDTIVSTGWPVAMIAREVIRLRPMTRAGVVRHSRYEGVPPLPLAPVVRGSRAIVLTDVILTGHLAAQVSRMVKEGGAAVIDVVAIVDAGSPSADRGDVQSKAVCKYDVQAVGQDSCSRCGRLERREFNPIASCMTSKKTGPRSPGQFLKECKEAAEFWKQVDMAHAYEHHRIEGNTHYVSFIDTERLLAHQTIGPLILSKLAAQMSVLVGLADILLIPPRARARILANKLLRVISGGRLWLPQVIAARQIDGRLRLAAKDSQSLKGAKVLIVETGVSSGSTLEELYNLATGAGAARVGAAVIISRLSEGQEAAVSTRLGGRFWRLHQLPIRPLSIPDALRHLCPICSRRGEIARAASESRSRPIVELYNEMHARRGRRPATTATFKVAANRDSQLRLAAEGEAPLLERCRRSTASGVALHSLYAARNDGMAPLRLPEICDDRIPTKNRTAMLEYLGSGAWKSSSESLFPDAKRLLDERDPDEIWVACAAFLNRSSTEMSPHDRGSCRYWIKALQSRLQSSSSARQQESKGVWNRLAFEVYWLLENEPSSRPELRERFEDMGRSCARTPAEAGINPILEIIQKAGTTPKSN